MASSFQDDGVAASLEDHRLLETDVDVHEEEVVVLGVAVVAVRPS